MADKKKCKKCGAPLEGFLFSTIGRLFGIKQSEKDETLCNKCEDDDKKKEPTEKVTESKAEEKTEEESEEETKQNKSEEKESEDGEDTESKQQTLDSDEDED